MKLEYGIAQPPGLVETWPGQYELFSWLEHAASVPTPVFIVTTRKESGLPNANLHSWGILAGGRDHYTSILAMLDHTHTHANILRDGEWYLNFPSFSQRIPRFKTIDCNGAETDEIAASGFTAEPSRVIGAPRIAECAISLECRLAWHRPLFDGGRWHLFAGEVVHAAIRPPLAARSFLA